MANKILLVVGFLGAVLTGPAGATMYVAVNGIDGPGCGTQASPCRSISQGIANATDGDTVIVGPGRYGDLDIDGMVDPGDEVGVPFCSCMFGIDRPITVVSSAGAAATVIDARPEENNLFGNLFCGLRTNALADLAAIDNYWGAPTGPGPDPADPAGTGGCNTNGVTVTSTPFATKPFSVKARVKP